MGKAIDRGATHLNKLCHKLYDELKGRGFEVDGRCCRCGGPLMTYYCEDRLYLIACEKCGTLALTKSAAPQVAANLTLRRPTLPQPSGEPLTGWVNLNERLPEKRKNVLVRYGNGRIGIDWIDSTQCFVFDELYGRVTHWMPLPAPPDRRPPEGETDGK